MAPPSWTSSTSATFEPDPATIRDVRRFVAGALVDDRAAADDVVLLASELATNAVIHAGTAYTVTVRVGADGCTRVEVADRSAAAARRCNYRATSGTGRGLGMVEDVASAWGIDRTADGAGKSIWFELAAAASSGSERTTRPARRGTAGADGDADLDAILGDLGAWHGDASDAAGPGGPASSARRAA